GAPVLEGLVGHHVTPVAGGVADGDEHRLVLCAGAGEGLGTPGQPVDGILGEVNPPYRGAGMVIGGQSGRAGPAAGRAVPPRPGSAPAGPGGGWGPPQFRAPELPLALPRRIERIEAGDI